MHTRKFGIEKGKTLNKLMGFKGLKSFATLYNGGSPNAYGWPDASMHTLKHELNAEGKIRFVSVHTTYFTHTEGSNALNNQIDIQGPMTQDEAIEFLKSIN